MKNRHISDAGVSFENIAWSVYQDLGWRTHFLLMAANYRLKHPLILLGTHIQCCRTAPVELGLERRIPDWMRYSMADGELLLDRYHLVFLFCFSSVRFVTNHTTPIVLGYL